MTMTADSAAALAASVVGEETAREEELSEVISDEELLGVGGAGMPLRDVVQAGGWITLAVLFGLNAVDEFDRTALQVLGPDIQHTFGMSDGALAFVNGIGGLFIFAGAIPLGIAADRYVRTRLIAVSSLLWSVCVVLAALARNPVSLGFTRVFSGLGKGNEPAQRSLLSDAYPVQGRGRVFAVHGFANNMGSLIGPVLAGGIAAAAGGSEGWRWSLGLLSIPCVLLTIASLFVKEPERGRYEREALALGDAAIALEQVLPQPRISVSAAYERLKKTKSFFYVMAALGALG